MASSLSRPTDAFTLRPGEARDLLALRRLIATVTGGLTTLPNEERILESKLDQSKASFASKVRAPGAEQYFFVLEDERTGELVGTSAIMARTGGFDPFYSYELRDEPIRHAPLGISKHIQVLHLRTDHKGPSEICSLFLRADLRAGGLGRLLSLGRFLFMAQFPERFDRQVIAEMRGFLDDDERSPFWETVGRHFFERDFHAADVLSGLGEKDFIRDLMPRHPIYVPLLPASVQPVIGRVHRDTEPALRLLLNEGFVKTGEVDIFDAGPLLRADLASVRTVQRRRVTALRALHPAPLPDSRACLVASIQLEFRATLGAVRENVDGSADLDAAAAQRLRLQPGAQFQYLPLYSERQRSEVGASDTQVSDRP